jgi:hypothetical protein
MLTKLVQEAGLSNVTERSSASLLFTVQSICELYISAEPEYHRDALEKLPFHAAVALERRRTAAGVQVLSLLMQIKNVIARWPHLRQESLD